MTLHELPYAANPSAAGQPQWNLFLRELRTGLYEIVMPDTFGVLDPVPTKETDNGYLVRWPCNPHFTGEQGIAAILQEHDIFKDAHFKTH